MTTTTSMQSKTPKHHLGDARATGDGAPTEAVPDAPTPPPSTSAPWYGALAAIACWWIALVLLVVFTANPVTLNAVQLKLADAIVTAELVDPAAGRLKVEREWLGRYRIETLELDPTMVAEADAGSIWLIPLTRTGKDRYEVTRAVIQDGRGEKAVQPAYIYPWTEETRQQLEKVLIVESE